MAGLREVDLLVVGAGPAGMTAALVASLEGLDVLLCEKSDQVGGTGATSAGTLWIPGNSQNKAAGYNDNAEDADRYLTGLIGEATHRDLRDAYLKSGPAVIDYLTARTDVQFVPCGPHPDYRSNIAGAAFSGRAISPARHPRPRAVPSCRRPSTGGCSATTSVSSARQFQNSCCSAE